MPAMAGTVTPGLATFLGSMKGNPVESSIEQLASLLKRRHIGGSRSCAIATAHLLRRVVGAFRITDVTKLIERIQQVGLRLVAAQPQEIAVGNIVRRVLRVIRDEIEENREGESSAHSDTGTENIKYEGTPSAPSIGPSSISSAGRIGNSLQTSHAPSISAVNVPTATSLFSQLSHPPSKGVSPLGPPGSQAPAPETQSHMKVPASTQDLRAEVIEGIQEIIDELNQVDDQIAGYAIDHVHSNEIILTHSPSVTVQKFLSKAAAAKRKFTIICVEAPSGGHPVKHATATRGTANNDDEGNLERFQKSLTVAGVTIVLVPDSAIYAVMSRVNKVLLDTHVILADGGLVATAGAKAIAKAASMHRTPVVVLSGVYKLSPVPVFDTEELIEYGDPSNVIPFDQGRVLEKVKVENPLYDYVPASLVDLCITNLGGHAPSFLYRIAADHYRSEDTYLVNSAA